MIHDNCSEDVAIPGTVVLTEFGVAVIIKTWKHSNSFQARLWRVPGKSVASSCVAFLVYSSIIRVLPAAPGMETTRIISCKDDGTKGNSKILVHCYSRSKDRYLVSSVNNGNDNCKKTTDEITEKSCTSNCNETVELFEIEPSCVMVAKCAKFYPLIHELIVRANETADSASLMLKDNDKISALISNNLTNDKTTMVDIGETKTNVEEISNEIVAISSSTLPSSNEVKKTYEMLKDEELTVLLTKGRERLKQLVSCDLPKATEEALRKIGVRVTADSSIKSTMLVAYQKALHSLDGLMQENLDVSLETIKNSLGDQFGDVFDSLSTAARSDSSLNFIFEGISKKTSEWQEQTGRLLSTRSADLFFEGAKRFQTRVGGLFTPQQLSIAQQSGLNLNKALTEGDVALTRLKSIELGESVRNRLVAAIELRSESQGGLDGIIAGALSSKGGIVMQNATDGMQSMLSRFQNSASVASKNAHESLITILSQKSQYQDTAILRIEDVLIDLNAHIGEVDAEQIAAIARGDGGTAVLFEPIARKAAKEIEKQLDAAAISVDDPRIHSVLSHVRRVISGDLSAKGLIDDVSDMLNHDSFVNAGENIAQKGEEILDVIENSSKSKTFGDIIKVVEGAGLTKDAVINTIGKLDADSLLEVAEGAITDEEKRKELLSSATDTALDFLLRILPSMPVPMFDGVQDGLLYSVSNLSMQGFKVKKEDISVQIVGINTVDQSSEQDSDHSDYVTQRKINLSPSYSDFYDPSVDSQLHTDNPSTTTDIKSTELLIIEVRNISAVVEKAVWSFEQTYLPYLKGKGLANVNLSDGYIKMSFELRKKRVQVNGVNFQWEPVLCLHTRTCSIGEIELVVEGGGKIVWIFNKLASFFKGSLRDYVVDSILYNLTNKSGSLLQSLNSNLSAYWDIILKTARLSLNDLAEASEDDIIGENLSQNTNEIDLVWRDCVPLGMSLLMNDESGRIKVAEFPRGSQARKNALTQNLDPEIFVGATIIGVNGTYFKQDEDEEMFIALKDPGRPKTVKFSIPTKEASDSTRSFVQNSADDENKPLAIKSKKEIDIKSLVVNTITLSEESLGITFSKSFDNCALTIKEFSKDSEALQYEKISIVYPGDILSHINGKVVIGQSGSGIETAVEALNSIGSTRPISLGFIKPYLELVTINRDPSDVLKFGGPEEFILEETTDERSMRKIVVGGFCGVDGVAEAGGVLIGDHLILINGTPVGAGCQLMGSGPSINLNELNAMFEDSSLYPMDLTFARPSKSQTQLRQSTAFNIEGARSITVIITSYEQLGCLISFSRNTNNFIVNSFHSVKGSFKSEITDRVIGLSFESINSEIVPSYASCDMVMSAIERSWNSGSLKILFCHDQRKKLFYSSCSDTFIPSDHDTLIS